METLDDKSDKNASLQLLDTYGDSDESDSEKGAGVPTASLGTDELGCEQEAKRLIVVTQETTREPVLEQEETNLLLIVQNTTRALVDTDEVTPFLLLEQVATRPDGSIKENEDIAVSSVTAKATAYLLDVENAEPVEENRLNDILEESQEIQDMVLKKNIINACAHGPMAKTSPTEEDEEEFECILLENSAHKVIQYQAIDYRDEDSDETVSSDSSSDIHSVKEVQDIDSSEDDVLDVQADGKRTAPKVKGELGLEDLPPIEDLAISVPEQECIELGAVWNIVDTLVIVQAKPQMPAVDLESVLFLEKGERPLGKVYDVFGPVTEPYYCVRFNSPEHIQEHGITRGLKVYVAPKTDHTQYVFLSELMKMRGSDASWLNDVEPPPSQVEYSDDEEERRAKKTSREQRRPQPRPRDDNGNKGEGERQGRSSNNFVERMNRRNLQRTAQAMRPSPNNPFLGNTENSYGYRQPDNRFQRVPFEGSLAGFFHPPNVARHETREWHNFDPSQMEAYRNVMAPPVFHYKAPPLPDMSVPPPPPGRGFGPPLPLGRSFASPRFQGPPPPGAPHRHNNPWTSGGPTGF